MGSPAKTPDSSLQNRNTLVALVLYPFCRFKDLWLRIKSVNNDRSILGGRKGISRFQVSEGDVDSPFYLTDILPIIFRGIIKFIFCSHVNKCKFFFTGHYLIKLVCRKQSIANVSCPFHCTLFSRICYMVNPSIHPIKQNTY